VLCLISRVHILKVIEGDCWLVNKPEWWDLLLFHVSARNGPLAGPVPTDMWEREKVDYRLTSVGLLLDITVDDSQWTSLFRIVRASFRGSMLRQATSCCGDLAHQFIRLLGVVFGKVSLRTQSRFGQVCVAPNTCDSYRDHGLLRQPLGW